MRKGDIAYLRDDMRKLMLSQMRADMTCRIGTHIKRRYDVSNVRSVKCNNLVHFDVCSIYELLLLLLVELVDDELDDAGDCTRSPSISDSVSKSKSL